MAGQEATAMEIQAAQVGELRLETSSVPYVNLVNEPHITTVLRVAAQEYAYVRSFPIAGNSAVMPDAIAKLQEDGRRVLVAERDGRYPVYLA